MRTITETELARAKAEIRENAMEFAQKTQPIFEANKWQWSTKNGFCVPSVDDIYFLVVSLASSLRAGNEMFGVSSGRVSISINKYTENGGISCYINLVPFSVVGSAETDRQ